MEKNNYQRFIAHVLGTRPIAFNPDLAKALGSAKAGLFLSQMLYWWGKGSNPNSIYKTIKGVKEETTLSRNEQDSAIKICKKLGLLEVTRKGIPARRHFRLNIEKIVELLESSLLESDKQDCGKATNLYAGNQQTISESNAKTTNTNKRLVDKKEKELIEILVNWNYNQPSPMSNAEELMKNTVHKHGYDKVSEALKSHGGDNNNGLRNFWKHLKKECSCCKNN